MGNALHIVVVEEDRARAMMIVDGLQNGNDPYRITVLGDTVGLARRVAEMNPDVVLIALDNPRRDMLEALAQAADPVARPVAMFVDTDDRAMMQAALEAGVSAYIVDGLQQERIRAILDVAVTRFHAFARMRAELAATKAALAERKTIDRAKGLLMKARGLTEEEAYALLRKTAMDQGKRLAEVAEGLVTAAGLLA